MGTSNNQGLIKYIVKFFKSGLRIRIGKSSANTTAKIFVRGVPKIINFKCIIQVKSILGSIMKKIPVISNSLIVKELLKLIFKKRDEKIHYLHSNEIDRLHDSVVIIDDTLSELKSIQNRLKANNNTIILLGESTEIDTDYSLKKPFLPKDIDTLLEKIPLKKREKSIKTKVLNPDEIAHIKALMDLDDEYTGDSEELTPIELLEFRESLKLKGKEAKEFLYEITTLQAKELKKLLKKSNISIKISFKDSEDE